MRWKHNRTRLFGAFGRNHVDHLRDHIACPTDNHLIANAQAKRSDFISIMQRGIADQHTSHLNRFQTRHRRNRPVRRRRTQHRAQSHLLLSRKFNATAQRGARAIKRNCSAKPAEFDPAITTPSISKPSVGRSFRRCDKIQYRTGRIAQRHAIDR